MSEELIAQEKPKTDKRKGIKADEFEQFKGEVMGMFGQIIERLNTPQSPVAEKVFEPMKDEGHPDSNRVQVTPAWIQLVEAILGLEFTCEYELPPDGGQKFTIIVPLDKTNADKEYLRVFKTDRRTKELGNTGVRGVKEWCLKVRTNLQRSGIKLPQYP